MKIDVNQVLEQLAQAFNTTVDKLYPILIKQAYVEAIVNIVTVIVFVAAWYVLYRIFFKRIGVKKDRYGMGMEDTSIFMVLVFSLFSVISFVVILVSLVSIPTQLINPEYWALKQVLDALSPNS